MQISKIFFNENICWNLYIITSTETVSDMNCESVKRHQPAVYSFYVGQRRFVSIRKWPLDVNFHAAFPLKGTLTIRNIHTNKYVHTNILLLLDFY